MENVWLASALWLGLALLASLISIRVAMSVALVEIMVGAVAGNIVGLHAHRLGQLPRRLRRHPADLPRRHRDRPPGRSAEALLVEHEHRRGRLPRALPRRPRSTPAISLGWPWPQAQIAGISLSTTSVAVVYAVMVETGFNKTEIGKIILAACFVNDLGHRARARHRVRALRPLARPVRRRDGGGAVAAAAVRALVLRQGRASGQRAGDQVRVRSSCFGSAAWPRSPAARPCCRPTSSAWRWRRPSCRPGAAAPHARSSPSRS